MDALGVTLAVLIVLGVLLFLAFFVFVAVQIFKGFQRMKKQQAEFDERWNNNAWDRFRK